MDIKRHNVCCLAHRQLQVQATDAALYSVLNAEWKHVAEFIHANYRFDAEEHNNGEHDE